MNTSNLLPILTATEGAEITPVALGQSAKSQSKPAHEPVSGTPFSKTLENQIRHTKAQTTRQKKAQTGKNNTLHQSRTTTNTRSSHAKKVKTEPEHQKVSSKPTAPQALAAAPFNPEPHVSQEAQSSDSTKPISPLTEQDTLIGSLKDDFFQANPGLSFSPTSEEKFNGDANIPSDPAPILPAEPTPNQTQTNLHSHLPLEETEQRPELLQTQLTPPPEENPAANNNDEMPPATNLLKTAESDRPASTRLDPTLFDKLDPTNHPEVFQADLIDPTQAAHPDLETNLWAESASLDNPNDLQNDPSTFVQSLSESKANQPADDMPAHVIHAIQENKDLSTREATAPIQKENDATGELKITSSTIQPADQTASSGSPIILPTSGLITPSETPMVAPKELMLTSNIQSGEWLQEMSDKLLWVADRNLKSAFLEINPTHLGPLQIQLHLKPGDEAATVNFMTQHPAVKQALEEGLPKLKELMEQQGLTLLQVNVSADQSSNPQGGQAFQSDDWRQSSFGFAEANGQRWAAHPSEPSTDTTHALSRSFEDNNQVDYYV